MSSDEGLLDIELDDLVHSPRQTTRAGLDSINTNKTKWLIVSIAGVALIVALCVVVVGIAWAVSSYDGSDDGSSSSNSTNPSNNDTPTNDTIPQVLKELASTVLSPMDKTVNPCDNFYEYACGGWVAKTTLPADKSHLDLSFTTIADRNEEVVKEVLEEGWPLISPFYQSCMNVSRLDQLGSDPIQPILQWTSDAVDSSTGAINATALFQLIARMHLNGISSFFSYYVGAGLNDTSTNVFYLYQGGLGLPSADYYLGNDDASKLITDAYTHHIERMLSLAGVQYPHANLTTVAQDIYYFERSLAQVSMSRAQMRDPYTIIPSHASDLMDWARAGGFDEDVWSAYFSTLGVGDFDADFALNVAQVNFTKSMLSILHHSASESPETVVAYMHWHMVNGLAGLLSSNFTNERFQFSKILYGTNALPSRWKSCVRVTNNHLGMITGHYFVRRMFPSDSKDIAHRMIENIESAFHQSIQSNQWMDDPTKTRAIEKLGDIRNQVGYPDEWPTYDGLIIRSDGYFTNVFEMYGASARSEIASIGDAVNKKSWGMYPSEVNAYYSPSSNKVVFPAGIMQPRFFNHTYLHSMNYGGMGSVIGHELTHGFDDEGSQYNGTGSLQNWWTAKTKRLFDERTQCLSRFYSEYTSPEDPSLHVNGNLTLGENLADLGGVKMALKGYHMEQERFTEQQIQRAFGMTNDQVFFVSYAQNWCEVASPAFLKWLITTNPHSPGMFRVLGPLSNTPEFAQAFQCPSGSPMNPEEKCLVW